MHGIITIKHTHLIYAPWLLLLCLTDPACYTASCVGNRLATEENMTEKKRNRNLSAEVGVLVEETDAKTSVSFLPNPLINIGK